MGLWTGQCRKVVSSLKDTNVTVLLIIKAEYVCKIGGRQSQNLYTAQCLYSSTTALYPKTEILNSLSHGIKVIFEVIYFSCVLLG